MRLSTKIAVAAVLVIFLALAVWTGFQIRSARTAADSFFTSLQNGAVPPDSQDSSRTLAENLLEFGLPDYTVKIRPAKGLSLRAEVILTGDNEDAMVGLSLARKGLGWQVAQATESSLEIRVVDGLPRLVLDLGEDFLTRDLKQIGPDKLLTVQAERTEWLHRGWLPQKPYYTSFVQGQPGSLLVGMEGLELFWHRDGLAAVLARQPQVPEDIRVNLTTTGHEGIGHSLVELSSSGPWQAVEAVTGSATDFGPGTVRLEPSGGGILMVTDQGEAMFGNRLIFSSASPDARLTLASIERSGSPPEYYGTLEVANFAGELIVVNELPLEQYLCFVVPGEMPASFGAKALEVQAVAARTYAIRSLLASEWQATSAHVVDSVLSQVYNNGAGTPEATSAVLASTGEIITYDGSPADVRYFSTSSGYTANQHEVWSDSQGNFPGTPVPWLVSRPQFPGTPEVITGESAYAEFIHNPPADAYDSASAWFRWSMTASGAELDDMIRENLKSLHSPGSSAVKLGDSSGGFETVEQMPEDPVGVLLDLVPVRRGAGGVLMELDIICSQGIWRVYKEYNIRHVLRPRGSVELVRMDDSRQTNLSLLPSAYVVWELTLSGEEVSEAAFYGGGYGHGVGMSQYGVRELADRGWTRSEIIQHYFPGAEILTIQELP